MRINYKKLHPEAIVPKQATPYASGFDLHALDVVEQSEVGKLPFGYEDAIVHYEGHIVYPCQTVLVRTGIALDIYKCDGGDICIEAQVRPRSGLAVRESIDVSIGTIDADYTGDIGVILTNNGTQPFLIRRGDRIAQLVFAPVFRNVDLIEVDAIDETERNEGAFGHTGTQKDVKENVK